MSRAALVAEAESLAKELGLPPPDLKEISRAKLDDLISGLKAQAQAKRVGAPGPEQSASGPPPAPPAPPAPPPPAAGSAGPSEADLAAAQADRADAAAAAAADAEALAEERALANRARGLPLPPGHKRPTEQEYVAEGYPKETYQRAMARWENELRLKFAAENQAKKPPVVDGARPIAVGGPPPPKPAKREPPNVPFYVAPKKSTVVGAKVVGPYTPVKASDFERGQKDLDYLISRGVVIRNA